MISLRDIYQVELTNHGLLVTIGNKMSALSDAVATLTANMAKLAANQQTNDTAIQAEIAALKDALTNGNAADVEAAIANISALSTKANDEADAIAQETVALQASLPPAKP